MTYFTYKQTAKVLQIEDTFAHLEEVLPNGDLKFEFLYSISQRDIVSYSAKSVKVTVTSQNVSPKPMLKSVLGTNSPNQMIKNILTHGRDTKTTEEQRKQFVVAQRTSDFTSLINNEVIPQLLARVPTKNIQTFNRPRLKLVPVNEFERDNDPRPILRRVSNSAAVPDLQATLTSSLGEIPQSLMYDMITRQGIDPSHIMNLTPRSQSEKDSHGGMSNPLLSHEEITDPTSRLLNSHLFPSTNGLPPTTTTQAAATEHAFILFTESNDVLDVPVVIDLPASILAKTDTTTLFITFDLINSQTGQSIDSVTKTLDVTQHLRAYYTPKLTPIVKAGTSIGSSRINLEITQRDPGAVSVQIFKKTIWVASTDVEDYSLIGTYSVTSKDQPLIVQVDKPVNSTVIYRVVSHGSGAGMASGYTNVVVTPGRHMPIKSLALSATQVTTGIQLTARHIPYNVVAIQFLNYNLTRHDKEYTIVNSAVKLIESSMRDSDVVTVIDSEVSPNHIYQYVARLIYDNGDAEIAGCATLEFIKPSPGQVDTKIENLVVSHDTNPNVSFDVNTLTVDTNLDLVKSMLSEQDQKQFFQGDLDVQRSELKKLIAHNIQRIDLTTGKREDFGTQKVGAFDDNALRKNLAIDPLVYGHSYRYEVCPLLRAAETMFDKLQKPMIDVTTKKPYSFYPARFLHPMALTRGVMVSTLGASKRYAKDPMSFGVLGLITTVDVSFDNEVARIVEPQATRLDRHLNVINWGVQGDINQIDHFLIMKQVHGIRTVLGSAHSEFENGNCRWYHPVSHHDNGNISYVIVAILNNYLITSDPVAITNSVLVEAP